MIVPALRSGALGLLALGGALAVEGGEPADDRAAPFPDDGRPARLEQADFLSCGACHETIAEEWAASLHALAWVDPHYRRELEGMRRPETCHGCHIPEPLFVSDPTRKPLPRSAEREPLHNGVSCRTCHEGPNGEMLGPFGIETDAHPSARSEHFLGTGANTVCISCHRTTVGPVIGIAKDFEVARLAGEGETCVGCHMPAVVRSHATDEDDVPAPEREGRSHALLGPRDADFLASAFEAEARFEEERVLVRVANRAGHRVPGLVTRSFRFVLEPAVDRPETSVERVVDTEDHLPVEGSFELELPVAADAVRLRGLHHAPGVEEPVPFLEETLARGEQSGG